MVNSAKKQGNFTRLNIYIYLFLYLIIWLAYFLLIKDYGLYEDDTRYIADPANLDFRGFLELIKYNMLNIEGGQGRIIGFSVPHFLAYLSYNMAGLTGTYFLGTLIILLNAILVYRFVLKILPIEFAILASLFYILYPADTAKILLVHLYQLQLSLTFTLLALNLYLSGKRTASFILAFCSLLTYEVAFLPFLVVPLFSEKWSIRLLRKQILHGIIIIGFFAIIFISRKLLGENRVSEMEGNNMIYNFIMSLIIGPVISAYTFLLAVVEVLINFRNLVFIFLTGLILFGSFSYFINYRLKSIGNAGDTKEEHELSLASPNRTGLLNIPILQLIIAAILMLISSYLLALVRFPPSAVHGRATSVHLASSVSGSILAAIIIYFVFTFFTKRNFRIALNTLIVLFLALLLSRGMLIQRDYAKSWTIQKSFWTELISKCPDIKESTILLVHAGDPSFGIENIYTLSWSLPEVISKILKFDPGWKSPPKVVAESMNYDGKLYHDGDGIFFIPDYPFLFEDREKVYLEDENIIYLNLSEKGLSRIDTTFTIDSTIVRSSTVNPDSIIDFQKHNVAKYYLNE